MPIPYTNYFIYTVYININLCILYTHCVYTIFIRLIRYGLQKAGIHVNAHKYYCYDSLNDMIQVDNRFIRLDEGHCFLLPTLKRTGTCDFLIKSSKYSPILTIILALPTTTTYTLLGTKCTFSRLEDAGDLGELNLSYLCTFLISYIF